MPLPKFIADFSAQFIGSARVRVPMHGDYLGPVEQDGIVYGSFCSVRPGEKAGRTFLQAEAVIEAREIDLRDHHMEGTRVQREALRGLIDVQMTKKNLGLPLEAVVDRTPQPVVVAEQEPLPA